MVKRIFGVVGWRALWCVPVGGLLGLGGGASAQKVSHLEVFELETRQRREVLSVNRRIEAPNWSRDGSTLLVNGQGRIYTVPVVGGGLTQLDTGGFEKCNNDHGYSPDGEWLAISDKTSGKSQIYVLPATGGTPRRVTLGDEPSFWHGWSPDGTRLAFCGRRDRAFDVYTVPVEGGPETRLTADAGHNDGPDYSPDGGHIYFNSNRTGTMKIWRMRADGSEQTQFSPDDAYADWFAHPSPDGQWVVFMSYDKSVKKHPGNKPVKLRIMPAAGGEPEELAAFRGGQGTFNVPSWSPDSKAFAFMSYTY